MWMSNTGTILFRLMLGIMVPTWFLSMWMSNTGTVSLQVNARYNGTHVIHVYMDV